MRFKGLDLNLLVAFDTLVEEQSVTRAAGRLHLSQPAMSSALGRLRDFFRDPILAAHGKKMVPTSQALQIRPHIREVLASLEHLIASAGLFDPATSERRFRIGVSDYLSIVLFAPLMVELAVAAPRIRIELVPHNDTLLVALEQGELDLIVSPEVHLSPHHPTELLFEERQVVVGWKANERLKAGLTEDDFFAAGHVAVELGRLPPTSFAEMHLRQRGRERRVEVLVTLFSTAPYMVVGTQRLTVMHERLAHHFARSLPIRIAPVPFDFPIMREMLQFHGSRRQDAGLMWLMNMLRAQAAIG